MKAKPSLAILVALGGLTALSIDIYLPALTEIARDLDTSMNSVQFSIGIFMVSFACGQLIFGPLSDHFGRRPPLLWGLILYGLANLWCALAPNISMLIVGRFLQGLAACCGAVSCLSIARDRYSGARMTEVLAKIAAVISLAPILAPLLGAQLTRYFGWRACFVVLFLFTVLLYLVIWRRLPETGVQGTVISWRKMPAGYLTILRHREFLRFSLVKSFAFGGLFVFIAGSAPLLMTGFHLSREKFSYLFASNAVTYLLGSHAAGYLSKRLSARGLAFTGSLVMTCAGVLMIIGLNISSHWSYMIPAYLATFGSALAMPAGGSGALAPMGERAGSAAALQGFIRFGVAALIGFLLSFVSNQSALPQGLFLSICALISLAASWPYERMGRWRTAIQA